LMWWRKHNSLYVIKTTELYTLKNINRVNYLEYDCRPIWIIESPWLVLFSFPKLPEGLLVRNEYRGTFSVGERRAN
jgi:hypothetical protein